MTNRLVETSESSFVPDVPLDHVASVRIPRRLLNEMIESLQVALNRLRSTADGSAYSNRLIQATAKALAEAEQRRGPVEVRTAAPQQSRCRATDMRV
jgi:hypothetical protein